MECMISTERIPWNEAMLNIANGMACCCTHYFGTSHESRYIYKKDSMDVIRHLSDTEWKFTDQVMDCDDILEGVWQNCSLISGPSELQTLRSKNEKLLIEIESLKTSNAVMKFCYDTKESENTILSERVKELEKYNETINKHIETIRKENCELISEYNYYRDSYDIVKDELTALKNSKTVFVRRK